VEAVRDGDLGLKKCDFTCQLFLTSSPNILAMERRSVLNFPASGIQGVGKRHGGLGVRRKKSMTVVVNFYRIHNLRQIHHMPVVACEYSEVTGPLLSLGSWRCLRVYLARGVRMDSKHRTTMPDSVIVRVKLASRPRRKSGDMPRAQPTASCG